MEELIRLGDSVKYKCLRCGLCCVNGPNVGLTAHDISRIARFLGVNWEELKGKYIVAVIADMFAIPTLRGKEEGKCVFLECDEQGRPACSIYPVRPMRCQLYPFMPYSPSNNEKVYLSTRCPGLKIDTVVTPPWRLLKEYYAEIRQHYARTYTLTFKKGYSPLEALEKTIEEIASIKNNAAPGKASF